MDQELVRFGILGCANIAKKMSAAILATPGACLYAIGSRSLEKAQDFAKENGFPVGSKIYGSYQGVLDDEGVDAVYIPLPTALHLEWALKAAQKRKHILIEKPAALSTEELDKIISACEEQGVQLMDCTMWMHHPRTSKMKEILNDRALFGDIVEVHSTVFVPMEDLLPGFFAQNIRAKPDLDALGALGDLGWYSARGVLWAYDYDLPDSVTAHPGTKLTKEGVITSCGAALTWEDGRVASFRCSFHANLDINLFVYGTNCTMEVPRIDGGHFKLHGLSVFEDMDIAWTPSVQDYDIDTERTQESLMVQRFSGLVKGITAGGTGSVDRSWVAMTRKTQQLLDAVKSSIEQGCRAVTVNK